VNISTHANLEYNVSILGKRF